MYTLNACSHEKKHIKFIYAHVFFELLHAKRINLGCDTLETELFNRIKIYDENLAQLDCRFSPIGTSEFIFELYLGDNRSTLGYRFFEHNKKSNRVSVIDAFVSPNNRNKGIGSFLFEEFIHYCIDQDVRTLTSILANSASKIFFKKRYEEVQQIHAATLNVVLR